MANYPHAGAISTGIYIGDWSDERPKNWRQGIAKLYPNGSMPLLALTSRASSQKTDDPQFYWWEEEFPDRKATVTGVYTDQAGSTAYTTGGIVGTTLYLQFADTGVTSSDTTIYYNVSKQFRAGQVVLLLNSADYNVMKRARVSNVISNGTVGTLSVVLLEADNTSGNKLNTCNVAKIIGNANPELGERPPAIVYRPEKYYNYTQIFRNSTEISRTAAKTRLRTEDAKAKAKKDALEQHGLDMELALLFGSRYETTGDNGQPMRYTMGLFSFLTEYAPSDNIEDYAAQTTIYNGKAWNDINGGRKWLNYKLENIFRYGRSEKLAVCGSGAILGINEICQNQGDFQFNSRTVAYGSNVTEWVTPFGTIYLKTHPLFSHDAAFRNTLLICEPQNMKFRYIDDTFFKPDNSERKSDTDGKDGTEEEWLTEGGWEFHHPKTGGILYNVGVDNELA